MHKVAPIALAAVCAGCLSPSHSALSYKNTVPPTVIGTVPSFDGGSACFPVVSVPPPVDAGKRDAGAVDGGGTGGANLNIASLASNVPAQVIFSETMDIDTLRPGLGLFQCPCVPGQEPQEVPLILTVLQSTTIPDYGQITQGLYPFTVQIEPAEVGNPCQPDGGNFGCFSSALYLLSVRTLLTDTAGNPLQQECQINFQAL